MKKQWWTAVVCIGMAVLLCACAGAGGAMQATEAAASAAAEETPQPEESAESAQPVGGTGVYCIDIDDSFEANSGDEVLQLPCNINLKLYAEQQTASADGSAAGTYQATISFERQIDNAKAMERINEMMGADGKVTALELTDRPQQPGEFTIVMEEIKTEEDEARYLDYSQKNAEARGEVDPSLAPVKPVCFGVAPVESWQIPGMSMKMTVEAEGQSVSVDQEVTGINTEVMNVMVELY